MTSLDEIKALVEEALDGIPPEHIALAKTVAEDAALLTARALAGEDVDAELVHVKAQAVALGAATKVRLENAIIEGIGRVGRRIVQGAILA